MSLCLPSRDTADAERKRKRASEDKSKSGEEDKRKKEEAKAKDAEKEPDPKKRKQSKDGDSSGSEDDEAGVVVMWIEGTRVIRSRFHVWIWSLKSQKNKGKLDKDARRRKADELREYVCVQSPSDVTHCTV